MDFLNLALNGKVNKRFDMRRFVAFREGYWDIVSSVFIEELMDLPVIGQYQILDDPFRPDMISHGIYGDTQFWWLIMTFNNEIFIDQLTLRRKLNFFSLADLDNLFYSLTRRSIPQPLGKA